MLVLPLNPPALAPVVDAVAVISLVPLSDLPLPVAVDSAVNTFIVTDGYPEKLVTAIQFPSWVGTAFKMTGLLMLVLGVIGWFLSPSMNTRYRGYQLAATGVILAIVGIGFSAFENLLTYVLTG